MDTLRHPAQSHGLFDSRADFKVLINTGVVEHHSTILRMDIGLHHFYLLCYNITIKIHAHPDHFNTQSLWLFVDVEFSQRGTLALLAAIGDAPINAWMSDWWWFCWEYGFFENGGYLHFTGRWFIAVWLITWQRVFLSHGYNNYLQKRERMHILNITEVNSLFPLLIEMEK